MPHEMGALVAQALLRRSHVAATPRGGLSDCSVVEARGPRRRHADQRLHGRAGSERHGDGERRVGVAAGASRGAINAQRFRSGRFV